MSLKLKILAVLLIGLVPCLQAKAQPESAQPETVDETAGPANLPSLQQPEAGLQRPTVWGEPTEVRIQILIIDIDNIDSANQNFSASLYYEARWENPLLKHDGPGPKIVPSTDIWTPRLTIISQQQAWNAFPSFAEISSNGQVVHRQKTWGWFSQPLDLREFPFDKQTLTIHLVSAGVHQTEVSMLPLIGDDVIGSGYSEKFSLADFEVISSNVESRSFVPFEGAVGNAGFAIDLVVRRLPEYYFWKIIVPLCFIVAMSWVPRWINPREIGANLGIAATSFLTLVAYLFHTAVLLPKVAYFTRMDYFIFMSTLIVFLGLMQTVLMCAAIDKVSERSLYQIDWWSRVVYPLILATVLGISFL